jgi:hypothetical protein
MPTVRKLAPEEVHTIENKGKGIRKITEEQYDQALADFAIGDYGELTPGPEENRLTARNRLKAAASRRGLSLTFLRVTGEVMRFKVGETSPAGNNTDSNENRDESTEMAMAYRAIPEPKPVPVSSEAPPKRKGGRPRKNP